MSNLCVQRADWTSDHCHCLCHVGILQEQGIKVTSGIHSLGKEKNADVRVVEKEAIGVCPRTSWGFGRAFTMQQKVVRIVAGIVAWCG